MTVHPPTYRVTLHLKKTDTRAVIRAAQAVYSGMSAHAEYFASRQPALADLLAQTQNLVTAQEAMATRAPHTRAVRDTAQEDLSRLINEALDHVQSLVNRHPDQAEILAHSAGMTLSKRPAPTKPILQARLTPKAQTVLLTAHAAMLVGQTRKSRLFNWQWSSDAEANWHAIDATSLPKTTVADLPPRTTVYFRVRSVVGGIQGPWSPSVAIVVP